MLKEIDLTICRFEELRWYKKKANHLKQQALALPTLQLFFTMQFTSTTDYNVFADFKSIEKEKKNTCFNRRWNSNDWLMPVNIVVIFNNKFIRVRDVRVGISQNTFKLLCPSALGFKFYETSIIIRSENDRVKTLKEFIWCASTSGCYSLSVTLSIIFGHHVRRFALIFESIIFLWYWHIFLFLIF